MIERDGKLYCRQHDPEAEAKRRRLSQLKYCLDNIKHDRRRVDQEMSEKWIEFFGIVGGGMGGYLFLFLVDKPEPDFLVGLFTSGVGCAAGYGIARDFNRWRASKDDRR